MSKWAHGRCHLHESGCTGRWLSSRPCSPVGASQSPCKPVPGALFQQSALLFRPSTSDATKRGLEEDAEGIFQGSQRARCHRQRGVTLAAASTPLFLSCWSSWWNSRLQVGGLASPDPYLAASFDGACVCPFLEEHTLSCLSPLSGWCGRLASVAGDAVVREDGPCGRMTRTNRGWTGSRLGRCRKFTKGPVGRAGVAGQV